MVVASLVVCFGTWFLIEKTRLGAYLRAATENPTLVGAFGINVPRLITLTYGFGVALAAFAGVLAAPIYSVNPNMGADLIIVVFAVVVIGGMGSILGAILTGFGLGIVEGLTQGLLPGGLGGGDLRHHGARAAGQARRPVRKDGLMAAADRASDIAVPVATAGARHARAITCCIFAGLLARRSWSRRSCSIRSS